MASFRQDVIKHPIALSGKEIVIDFLSQDSESGDLDALFKQFINIVSTSTGFSLVRIIETDSIENNSNKCPCDNIIKSDTISPESPLVYNFSKESLILSKACGHLGCQACPAKNCQSSIFMPITVNGQKVAVIQIADSKAALAENRIIMFLQQTARNLAVALNYHNLALDNLKEQQWNKILQEYANEGIAIVDNEKILRCNNVLLDMFGYNSSRQPESIDLKELFAYDSYELLKNKIRQNNSDTYDLNAVGDDGHQFQARIFQQPGVYGYQEIIILSINDKSRYNKVEKEIVQINNCFLHFSSNPSININRLTALLGQMLNGSESFYYRIDKGLACAWGQWSGTYFSDELKIIADNVCSKLFENNENSTGLITDLSQLKNQFQIPEKLHSYMAHMVKSDDNCLGAICVLFDGPRFLTKEDNYIVGIVASAIAVQEKQLSEEIRLRDSEEKYRALFNNAEVGMFRICAESLRWLALNQKMLDILGYKNQSQMPWPAATDYLAHKYEREALIKTLLKNGRVHNYPLQIQRSDGTNRHCVLAANYNKTKQYFEGSCVDVTEEIRAEKDIIQYQHKLRKLAAELTFAEERERKQLAYELHENISQLLGSAQIKLDILSQKSQLNGIELNSIRDLIANTIDHAEKLTHDTSTPILYEMGLRAAIERLIEEYRKKYPVKFFLKRTKEALKLNDNQKYLLYKVVRELINEFVEKGHCTTITTNIRLKNNLVLITIEASDINFDMDMQEASHIFGIRERLSYMGGDFRIDTSLDAGTKAIISMPTDYADII